MISINIIYIKINNKLYSKNKLKLILKFLYNKKLIQKKICLTLINNKKFKKLNKFKKFKKIKKYKKTKFNNKKLKYSFIKINLLFLN